MLTQHLAGEDLEEHGGRARRKRATEEAFLERLWARALTSGVAQQKPITVEFAEPGELGIALESPGQVPPPHLLSPDFGLGVTPFTRISTVKHIQTLRP